MKQVPVYWRSHKNVSFGVKVHKRASNRIKFRLASRACYRCGNDNSDQAFCGACGSPLSFNDYLSKSIREQLDTQIRDRDVLETESAIKVFEKALGWVKNVGYLLGAVLAVAIALGVWKGLDLLSSINAAKQSVIDTSTKAQTQINQTATKAAKSANSLSNDLKTTGDAVTADMARQAVNVRREVADSRLQLQAASKLGPEMTAMQQQLTKATADIQAQQKVISSSEDFVKDVFSSHITDIFGIGDLSAGPRYATIEASKGGSRSVVFLLLSAAPVQQTLQLQFRVFSQPPGSYVSLHNIVIFFWGDPLDNLKNQQLSASYFPDKSDKELIHSLIQRDGRVYADGEPLPKYNQPDPDFKGNKWLSAERNGDGVTYRITK